MQLTRLVRKYLLQKSAEIVVANYAEYQSKVEKRIYYRVKILEQAMNKVIDATTEDEKQAAYASLTDARADFYDDMREYLLVDLTNADESLPTRPADYAVEEVKVTTHYVGHNIPVSHYTRTLVKKTSSEMPELNYPKPFWQGYTKDQIEEEIANFVERAKNAFRTETSNS